MITPKCPWCGGEVITKKSLSNWVHECEDNCYSSCWYSTEEEALFAASKRFMPNRTVSEIKAEYRRLVFLRDEELLALFKGRIVSEDKKCSWWDIALAKLLTRIADFIYGVDQ